MLSRCFWSLNSTVFLLMDYCCHSRVQSENVDDVACFSQSLCPCYKVLFEQNSGMKWAAYTSASNGVPYVSDVVTLLDYV